MMEPASEVLAARARLDPASGRHNLAWSLAAHAMVLATVAVWPRSPSVAPVRTVMTVSLTGAPGPRTGGRTEIGGRETGARAAASDRSGRAAQATGHGVQTSGGAPAPAENVGADCTEPDASGGCGTRANGQRAGGHRGQGPGIRTQ